MHNFNLIIRKYQSNLNLGTVLGIPKTTLMLIHYEDLQNSEVVILMAMVYSSKRIQSKISNKQKFQKAQGG